MPKNNKCLVELQKQRKLLKVQNNKYLPLKKLISDVSASLPKNNNHSRSLEKEILETSSNSKKRKHSITDKDNTVLKKLCQNSKLSNDLQDESTKDLPDKLVNLFQNNCYKSNLPHTLIKLMYQSELSILCLIRNLKYQLKYPSLSLKFEDNEIDKFNNIVFRYQDKSIRIHIENVDKYYLTNNIDYAQLFNKKRQSPFFLYNYFNSYVKYILSNSNNVSDVEYLIIYTNLGLDLAEDEKLKPVRLKKFYPFKLDRININKCEILQDFLFIDDLSGCGFYQFSQDETMIKELLNQLEFCPPMQRVIKEKKVSQKYVKNLKKTFLSKLVFAVNQPSRSEIKKIVINEIEKNNKVQEDYETLHNKILDNFKCSETIYEFNLVMSLLHTMYLNKNLVFVHYEGKTDGTSNDIVINYRGRISYIKACITNNSIGYSHLFSSRQRKKDTMDINKHFNFFIDSSKNDLRYYIIYTNGDIELAKENVLKKGPSKFFYPFRFEKIDIQKKKYKLLRNCLCINQENLYQFGKEETREKVLNFLKLPTSLQEQKKEGKLSDQQEKDIKEKFLNSLIFAFNQPNVNNLNSIIRNEIGVSNVPYNYENLHEMSLCWSESHEFGFITKEIMDKLIQDLKSNKFSYETIKENNITEEIIFAKNVIGRERTFAFNKFLDFLIKGEGKNYLKTFKKAGISLISTSNILHGAGVDSSKAFKDLHDLWFDAEENKTEYLKVLEIKGIDLAILSSILHGARANAAEAFKDLYNLWFDQTGNKTQYMKTLEREGINLSSISSILHGVGLSAAKAFKELYNLLFDSEGNKTQYLMLLEKQGINLTNMSSILSRVRTNTIEAYKDLYNLWFTTEGNKSQYLKTLEKEGISLSNICNILSGVRSNPAKSFKDLFNLWFDVQGSKTVYLKTLEKERINLASITSILSGAGANATEAFIDLYNLWFDAEGNKTQYLKVLQEEKIDVANVFIVLHGTGLNAAKTYRDLYDLWFTAEGNKTHYLKTLEKEGISLVNVSNILHGAKSNAANAFKDLHSLWFDEEGNKKQHLEHFINNEKEEKNFTLHNLSSIFCGVGAKFKEAFKKFHTVCFNDKGIKTKLLDDFYKVNFRPSDLSCILNKAGVRASIIIKKLHNICFKDKGEKTTILDDFYKIGFKPRYLCSILSGAADSLENFHNFCFTEKKIKYLDHFFKEGFTIKNLCNIFQGAGNNICSAFKEFYSICFNNLGEITQLLDDFFNAGFRPNDLSRVLSMAGINATSILLKFHKLCFNKKNYLNHFLTEEELFSQKNLSKVLCGVGVNIKQNFKELHHLCFDKLGNKTNYLNNLIKNNPSSEIIDLVHEKIRKTHTFLDDKNFISTA